MFNKLFQKSKSVIGNNSNGNTILQNSTIYNPVITTGSNELLQILNQSKKYDEIQKIISSQLAIVHSLHPLAPDFAATIDPKLKKLISTPETPQAFINHPKKIKGTYEVDYKKYPTMSKNETPWEYAYRT